MYVGGACTRDNPNENGHTEHYSVSSDEISPDALVCQPCKEFKHSDEAATKYCAHCHEYLCVRCSDIHCEPKPSRHHKLVDIEEATQRIVEKSVDKNVDTENHCSRHTHCMAGFYCWNHKVFQCSICVVLHHRMCDHVVCVVDEGETIQSNYDFLEMQTSLSGLQLLLVKVERGFELLKGTLDKNRLREREGVHEYHGRLVDSLNQLKEALLLELDTVDTEHDKLLENFSEKMESIKSKLQLFNSDIEENKLRKDNVALFKAMVRSKTVFSDIDSHVADLLETPLPGEIVFDPATAVETLLTGITDLGKIQRTEALTINIEVDSAPDDGEILEHRTAQTVNEINIQMPDDLDDNSISGMIVLSDNVLALVDRGNQSVRVVDCLNKSITSHLELPGGPWDVAEVSPTKLAVSIPNMSSVRLVNRTTSGLSLDYSIDVVFCCYGITCVNDTIIASCIEDSGDFIALLTMTGEVLKTIATGPCGRRLFNAPMYVRSVPKSDTFYVSNTDGNDVISMNMDGDITARYELKRPRGMAALSDGKLYVNCEDNCVIYEIDSRDSRKPRRLLIEDSCQLQQTPIACTCGEGSMLVYVCSHQSGVVRVLRVEADDDKTA